jgi:3',5'-cyclic AMP phosphodiesterase CpdA
MGGVMRVLHFSDVHVQLPLGELPVAQFFNKRLLGAANLVLRRGEHFAEVPQKLQALAELCRREAVDLVLSTGDFTALGTEPELRAARQAIDGLTHAPLGFVCVPGNHDIYLPDAVLDGRFERCFGDLLGSDWPERTVDGLWPCVRLIGADVAVVALNSARPNPQPWRSSGRIAPEQLTRLTELLREPELQRRFVFVITHYALRRRDGSRDRLHHGLENADALVEACRGLTRGALLHGHIHWRYTGQAEGLAVPYFGAGSATHSGREGIWLFEVDGAQARAFPGRWTGAGYELASEPERVF